MTNYKIYPSILDKFEGYINSSKVYQQYYGFSEEPSITEEEFEQKKFRELIDGINRVPMKWEDSEAADKGTAFNEVIDCLVENRKSDKMEIERVFDGAVVTALKAKYNNRSFEFPMNICKEFVEYLNGTLTQQFVEAVLPTRYGNVLLYGYVDELLPFKVVDIKTTSKYTAYKYRDAWQRIAYPYCLNAMGNKINDFEFAVTDFKNTWIEHYSYNPEKDIPELTGHCEAFIEFLEANQELIINQKIFAEE